MNLALIELELEFLDERLGRLRMLNSYQRDSVQNARELAVIDGLEIRAEFLKQLKMRWHAERLNAPG